MDDVSNKIEREKNIIELLLIKKIITEKMIKEITVKNFQQILDYGNSEDEVNKYLYNIYIKPYLICTDKPILDLDIIAELLVKRYNMEQSELNLRFKKYDINLSEYIISTDLLNNLYFNSSNTGKKIKRYYNDSIIKKCN